jgi:endo-1,4-beta-xylanase
LAVVQIFTNFIVRRPAGWHHRAVHPVFTIRQTCHLKAVLWSLFSMMMAVVAGLPSAAGDWRSDADTRIEQLRKRDAQIQIVDENKRPASGVRIEVRQIRKSFPFGAAMTGAMLRNPQYQQFFREHFNWAVFGNESKWYANERDRGRVTYAAADAMLAWCRSNHILVRGHCLFWEPERWQPAWVRTLGSNDLRAAVAGRLNGAITHFQGQFQHWDVDNEMLHGSFFKDHLGEDIHLWMFQRAHELDPAVKLFVNEFNILSVDQGFPATQADEYVTHTRKLIAQGAPVGGVGIQGHLWKEDILAKPEVIKERLDQLATLNLPIWITEFDVADENAQTNADKLELVYRTAYSHSAVAGIMMWVVWAGDSWRGPNAGLARADWSLNPAGERFERLMREWSTTASGATDASGTFSFRGFHGEYEVTIAAPGKPASLRQFTLEPGNGASRTTLQINGGAKN